MRLAAQGLRNLDQGEETVEDETERAALRSQARKVYLLCTGTALVLTGIAVVL